MPYVASLLRLVPSTSSAVVDHAISDGPSDHAYTAILKMKRAKAQLIRYFRLQEVFAKVHEEFGARIGV